MARKNKNTVEYFPLYCTFGDALQAIEDKYGNDGFIVWVKTMQKLGKSENHFIDCRNPKQWILFYSRLKMDEKRVIQILDELADLDCIDRELWAKKIIFSQNFVNNISDVYKRRKTLPLTRDEICAHLFNKCMYDTALCTNNADKNTQSKVNKNKVNEITPHNPPKNEIKETGGQDFLNFSKVLSGVVEADKLQKLYAVLCEELGNKKFVAECANDWLLSVYNHKEKTNFPAKSLLSYARKNFKKYAVAKSSTPTIEQTREYLDEQMRNKSNFNPLDLNTKEEAINYIKKLFPPHQRGRTYGQKKLIKKFNLRPCDYSGEYVEKKGV